MIAFCAILCGAEDYEDIEEFGKARCSWLEQFVELPNGIPDKDTFRRVFERLNPTEVAECAAKLECDAQNCSTHFAKRRCCA